MKNVKKSNARKLPRLFSIALLALVIGGCGGAVTGPPAHPTTPGGSVNAGGTLGGSPVNPVGPHG